MDQGILDLIIIGGSAAGGSAAIYASRRRLNYLIIAKDLGGEVALSGEVENWPGTIYTNGVELSQNFQKHLAHYNAPTKIGVEVTGVEKKGPYFSVKTKNFSGIEEEFITKTVIVASGIHPRSLNITGEENFRGKGVTYCTVCDGPLYKNKVTVTIGAGNAALESALMMSEIAERVYLVTKYPNTPQTNGGFPKGENILVEKVKNNNKIEVIYNSTTTEIKGGEFVNSISYLDNFSKENKEIKVQGVMVHIGNIPNSSFISLVEKNTNKEIIVNLEAKTSIPGIFAAGDVTNIPFKQIVIASGQGVIAALSAIDYLNRWQETN